MSEEYGYEKLKEEEEEEDSGCCSMKCCCICCCIFFLIILIVLIIVGVMFGGEIYAGYEGYKIATDTYANLSSDHPDYTKLGVTIASNIV